MFATACVAISLTTAFADEQTASTEPAAQTTASVVAVEAKEQKYTASVNAGIYKFGVFDEAKSSVAFTPEFTYQLPDPKFKFLAKALYTQFDYKYDFFNVKSKMFGFSGELQYEFLKEVSHSMYVSGGFMYRKVDLEIDETYLTYGVKDSANGFAPFAKVGVEYTIDEKKYLDVQVGYMSKLFDKDEMGDDAAEAQFGINATHVWKYSDDMYFNANLQYLSSWKELIVGGGITFLF